MGIEPTFAIDSVLPWFNKINNLYCALYEQAAIP